MNVIPEKQNYPRTQEAAGCLAGAGAAAEWIPNTEASVPLLLPEFANALLTSAANRVLLQPENSSGSSREVLGMPRPPMCLTQIPHCKWTCDTEPSHYVSQLFCNFFLPPTDNSVLLVWSRDRMCKLQYTSWGFFLIYKSYYYRRSFLQQPVHTSLA